MGALGDMIKSDDAEIRSELGATCTLNGSTSLGKCGLNAMNGEQVRNVLGDDYADEQDLEWAMIEADPHHVIIAQNSITVTATGRRYIVRRVTKPVVDDVVIANRCLCVAG